MTEHDILIQSETGSRIRAVAFSTTGHYLVSGDGERVRVWRMQSGDEVASMPAQDVNSLAVSKDDGWISAGTAWGRVFVWNAKTYEPVLSHQEGNDINGVDFSLDSTRLLVASRNRTATVWDIASYRPVVGPLCHERAVRAARYSPAGDRIATVTGDFVRVYDSSDGRLLMEVRVVVTPWYQPALLWSTQHWLFIISNGLIKQMESSSGSTVSEWLVPTANYWSCIVLPQHRKFIAYSTINTVTFWDTSTHSQLGLLQDDQQMRSIALSPDDRFLAIGGKLGEITIKQLSGWDIADSMDFSCLYSVLQDAGIQIDDTALYSWKDEQFTNAEALLTTSLYMSQNPSHLVLASRAFVRGRLQQWDAAIDDAEESIKIQSSVIGYIAKSVALIGKGEKCKGYSVCDTAFEFFPSAHDSFMRLIKAIILSMAGEHSDAISSIDDFVGTSTHFNSTFYVVQAYIYFLLGNSCMERKNYNGAIQSFECATQIRMKQHWCRPLWVISFISGWSFDRLGIRTWQYLCESLYAAGHMNEAGKSLLKMMNTFEEVYVDEALTKWVSNFSNECLSTPEYNGDSPSERSYTTSLTLLNPSPLLREWGRATTRSGQWKDALNAAVNFTAPRFTVYRVICECLTKTEHLVDAADCVKQMARELRGETNVRDVQKWILDFRQRLAENLVHFGDAAANTGQHTDAIAQYSAALALNPAVPQNILIKRSKLYTKQHLWEYAISDTKRALTLDPLSPWSYEMLLVQWARVKLTDGSWRNALTTAGALDVPRSIVYLVLCDRLETIGCIADASECLHEMSSELAQYPDGHEAKWIRSIKYRCYKKLDDLGDAAANAQRHDKAIYHYSAALSLPIPTSPLAQRIRIKRSKASVAEGLWEDALNDANEVIMLDPSSPWGYERKHAALHRAGRYEDAVHMLETMLSKISRSLDPDIYDRHHEYVAPERTKMAIRKAVQDAICDSPRVLINTISGHLCDKYQQAAAFEQLPIFSELVSSMTTHIDHARIEQEVREYYRYTMFSHVWEINEPLFEKVTHIVVYELEESPTHHKLQMFCKIVRDAGFQWAWSDTCCINKVDHFVLQEALVSMFMWYEGSSLTVIFLRGVRSPSQHGDLARSLWNTRAWTLQEYHASKVIRFYTEDWTPYLNFDIHNHKESREIIAEMEKATGVSAQTLIGLRPGSNDIREKLCLASRRESTFVEDAAYSLLGIFSASLPIVYGEKNKALGRLLAQLLTSSGDTSIIAWTGRSGKFNSCLPADIAVFSQMPTSHIPPAANSAHTMITKPRANQTNDTLVMKLYDRLNELPVAMFIDKRMKLPCIMFKLGPLSASSRIGSGHVFRAKTDALGIVDINTTEDLSRLDSLILVHPWIDFLLNRQPIGNPTGTNTVGNADQSASSDTTWVFKQAQMSRLLARLRLSFGARPRDTASLLSPSPLSLADKRTEVFQFLTRLRQPFGALLLTQTRKNVAEYRRVAAESVITVQVKEDMPFDVLIDNVRLLDVL